MWIKYSEQKPEEGKDLWYFFDIVGVHKGQYYGCGEFAGDKGFLRYDVTHWQYDVGQERPERPEGFIGFYWWLEDGIRHYRCRGIGQKYDYFYKVFVPSSSYRSTSEDFPWDFFVFDNEADHERLLKQYPDDVEEDK